MIADVLPLLRESRFALDLELLVLARRLGYTRIVEAPVRIRERFGSTISLKAVWLLLVGHDRPLRPLLHPPRVRRRAGWPPGPGRIGRPRRTGSRLNGRPPGTGAPSGATRSGRTLESNEPVQAHLNGRRTEDQVPHDPTAIRNVALVGHHGAGKTTLAEALLAATGSIARRGSVEKGSTVMDFEPEEVARQLSISTSLAPFTVNGVKVNLLDTPGYADFAGEMVTALANVDLAVVVVSATDGVQAQTEDAWRAAARLGVPRVIVINKLDRERADFDRTLAEIRASFGAGVAPVELPIGHEADFHGVIDLLDDTATHYDTSTAGAAVDGTVPPAGHEGPIPDDLVDEEHTVHEQLVEGIVVGDDDLMERYLNGETLDYGELEKSLAGGVASASVFPVLCCSAASGVGVDRLARLIEELCPSPASRPPLLATRRAPRRPRSRATRAARRC